MNEGRDRREADAPTAAPGASEAGRGKVVPFPPPRRKPAGPTAERVLLDLDDFDPGPGAA